MVVSRYLMLSESQGDLCNFHAAGIILLMATGRDIERSFMHVRVQVQSRKGRCSRASKTACRDKAMADSQLLKLTRRVKVTKRMTVLLTAAREAIASAAMTVG